MTMARLTTAKIKPYIRDKNLIIMWPKGLGHDGKYVKIPLPYGFAPFHVIGDRVTALAMGKDKIGAWLLRSWPRSRTRSTRLARSRARG
jgi:hypothetical protein